MNILVVMAHYCKAEPHARHASLVPENHAARRELLEEALLRWRLLFGRQAMVHHDEQSLVSQPAAFRVDLRVLVTGEHHVLDAALLERHEAQAIRVNVDNPRYLPFAAHHLMARHSTDYDWYVYTEDDIGMVDPAFFYKQAAFQRAFGPYRVLQPHRFEKNAGAFCAKTYVDGPLAPGYVEAFVSQNTTCASMPPDDMLTFDAVQGLVQAMQPPNPHAGFFALSAPQLNIWMTSPHFLDLDSSFVSPLESAATLGLLKTFAVLKTLHPHRDYLEVEHLHKGFSNLPLDCRHAASDLGHG